MNRIRVLLNVLLVGFFTAGLFISPVSAKIIRKPDFLDDTKESVDECEFVEVIPDLIDEETLKEIRLTPIPVHNINLTPIPDLPVNKFAVQAQEFVSKYRKLPGIDSQYIERLIISIDKLTSKVKRVIESVKHREKIYVTLTPSAEVYTRGQN